MAYLVLAACLLASAGCISAVDFKGGNASPARHSGQEVPYPVSLQLPKTLQFHPFTQTASFGDSGWGVLVRLQALDHYGDTTKAYGDFRFDLYTYKAYQTDHKGEKLATWESALSEGDVNQKHWKRHFSAYEFTLGGLAPMTPGQKYVLVVTFTSSFKHRLRGETVVTAGS